VFAGGPVGVLVGTLVGVEEGAGGGFVRVAVGGGGGAGRVGVALRGEPVAVGCGRLPHVPAHDPVEASHPQWSPGTHVPLSCWQMAGPTKLAYEVSMHNPPLKPSNAQQPVGLHAPLSPDPMTPLMLLSLASTQVVKPGHATWLNFPGLLLHVSGGTFEQVTLPFVGVLMHGAAPILDAMPQVELVAYLVTVPLHCLRRLPSAIAAEMTRFTQAR